MVKKENQESDARSHASIVNTGDEESRDSTLICAIKTLKAEVFFQNDTSSRRCNFRVTGVKDSHEDGNRPVEFLAYLPKTALGLDKSHRSL